MNSTYSNKQSEDKGPQRTFLGNSLQQISFPLGGIGAGCLHIGAAGNFQDFVDLTRQPLAIRR